MEMYRPELFGKREETTDSVSSTTSYSNATRIRYIRCTNVQYGR